jgi:hypothetical protein
MNRPALATLFASLAAPAFAFGIDLALPTLTWPTPDTATPACATPTETGTPTCPQQ